MPKRLLSNLTWKAGVAAATFALAAGTGATTIHFVNSSSTEDTPAVTTTTTHTPNENANDNATADSHGKAADANGDAQGNNDSQGQDHPDNFGKTVSGLAHDGGAGDDNISDLAHAKNDARKNSAPNAHADTTGGDHATDGEDKADDANDDHGVDGQQKADDANDDHGSDESGD